MPEQVERRKHRRLPLRFPVFISGEGETGRFVEHTTTENISGGGVYFGTSAWEHMPPDTQVHVYIEVPSNATVFLHQTRLKSVGRVVRVDDGTPADGSPEGSKGVAVRFERELRFAG